MEVAALLEGFDHGFAVGHVCEDPKLKLAIVSDDELVAFLRYKGEPDLVLVFVQCWLVLQIRSPRGESARLRVNVQTAMHTAVLICQVLQRSDEGLDQSLNASVFEQVT